MEMVIIILLVVIIVLQIALFIFSMMKSRDGGDDMIETLKSMQEQSDKVLREDIRNLRQDHQEQTKDVRTELVNQLHTFNDTLLKRMHESSVTQKNQFDTFSQQLTELTRHNDERLEAVRKTLETKLGDLQKDNNSKLEKMRETVDEKLHATLEKRLTQSFQSVSDRLEQVHKGLGEMQTLASGVGDLKKVISNVKTRGIWGEVQLAQILEQMLSPEQYQSNVATKKGERGSVEFAIKLPGRDKDQEHIWLPIDAKFPIEDYQRLVDASEEGNLEAITEAQKAIEKRFKEQAKTIQSKYLDPPHTTDFALMFVPVEGLYAEVLKIPGFVDQIQRDYRVIITGPTTITAILNSLQMGFRTLAIEKQSSEIWKTLSEVKTEFGRFGDVLDKTQKKLQEASNHIDSGSTRARAIERKLRHVDTSYLESSDQEL